MLAALTGALVGGLMTALVAWKTIQANQRHERELRAEERRVEATTALITALVHARTHLLDESGALRTGDEARAAAGDLRREIAVALPHLKGCNVQNRLETLWTLLQQTAEALEAMGLSQERQAEVGIRLSGDRLRYLDWVVESLQAVAMGDVAPPDTDIPAPPTAATAKPWTAPAKGSAVGRTRSLGRITN